MMKIDDKALTIQEVAQFLNISKQMAYNMVKDQTLEAFKIGSATRIMYSDLLHYVQNQKYFYARRQSGDDIIQNRDNFIIKNLEIQAGDFHIGQLSFSLPIGKILCILGPSGSGKTLLLRGIAGLEPLTGGTIYSGDRRIDDRNPYDRRMSFVFEDYALFPHLNVKGNIEFPLSVQHWKNLEKELTTNLRMEELDIEKSYTKRLPNELPEGIKQLVAIAREKNNIMDLFLMDEPMTHLDAARHQQLRIFIKKIIFDMGKTTIISTNSPQDALLLSDFLLLIDEGKILQFGETWEVYNHPGCLKAMEITSINVINTLTVNIVDGETTPLGLKTDREDGQYVLAFRSDEVKESNSGITCKLSDEKFYDGGHRMVHGLTNEGQIFNLLLPLESLKDEITIQPLKLQLFKID